MLRERDARVTMSRNTADRCTPNCTLDDDAWETLNDTVRRQKCPKCGLVWFEGLQIGP